MNGKIETERLLLRPLSPSDAEAVFAYSREANVGINAGWKPHESLEESEDALEKVFCGKKGIFGIVHKIDGKLIGTIGVIDDPKRSNPKAEMLGYAMSESYWGKGLMTEAAQAVLRFAFGPMALDLVSAYCYPHNLRSKRVLEKCGFAYEGRLAQSELRFDGALMDEECYVLLKNKSFKE